MSTHTIKKPIMRVMDGNEAAADVAYRLNEICIIYPITPSSQMGELADQWSAEQRLNYQGTVPEVIEMQSEAGAAGAIHGALQTGALATTFTASQGLLLMIPNMYRIAAELTPTVFHVAARIIAPQGMSIYCDHSDVMATRATGFAMLCSANVQEAHDMALIAQAVSLKSRIPVLHFFDGFRTSHEISKIAYITDDLIKAMIDDELVLAHRERRMSAENPFVRGAIYDSDIFFQQRESVNPFYTNFSVVVTEYMERFAKLTGRRYGIIEYFGHPKAEKVIILMGSGTETVIETVAYLQKTGQKVGVLKIRLFQPFSAKDLLLQLPDSCKSIAVLDRTKEPGAGGEPLYQRVSTAILEACGNGVLSNYPKIIAGRFGIGSKEFTPSMVKAIFDELDQAKPKNHFTIGIEDDLTYSSLAYDSKFAIEDAKVVKAIFYGLGADGTVGANKNSAKIIGEETDFEVQGYFVYDSKKSGSRTVSHLRFGPEKIRSAYLINEASFIGCHQFNFVNKINILEFAANDATLLLNSSYSAEDIWNYLPCSLQQELIDKKINFYIINADKVAKETKMGNRINTIMQTCFFALAKILPREDAIAKIKNAIAKTYAKKGEEVIKQNFVAVDYTLQNLHEVKLPAKVTNTCTLPEAISNKAPEFVRNVIGKMIADKGNSLSVSCFQPDGTFPSETTKWEKRNVSPYYPIWNEQTCIQCGRCSLVCPHSIIRVKSCVADLLNNAPKTLKSAPVRRKDVGDQRFILQTYPENCTGCGLCEETCPVKEKAIKLGLKEPHLTDEGKNIEFFEQLPSNNRNQINSSTVAGMQFLEPMFEFCGACAGCGESPYVKLVTQLFGDRMIIANACGCSSVYGGSLPTVPWTHNLEGRGPSWSSSLFEDNAEFGFGFRLTADKHQQQALELLTQLAGQLNSELVNALNNAIQQTEEEINQQRQRVIQLKQELVKINDPKARLLLSLVDYLVKHSIWSIGGDGWAYDIGFGGLDHVIASGRDINLLILDTEAYSNTGGQASKATSRGAVVKFAANGKNKAKKDLGLMAMSYGDVYVASIALGANPMQAIKAIKEAESYPGPSIIIAYSHCIAHGIDMRYGMRQQELAVKSGYWLLYRYNPELENQGQNPLQLDSASPTISFEEYAKNENRFQILALNNPKQAKKLMQLGQEDIIKRWRKYELLAKK
jgi:pyruvate-ferredoxin/flavodoxin oxidoreductase